MAEQSRYRLTPQAVADLETIWDYTAQTWSLSQAEIYYTDLVNAFEGLADGSRIGRPVDVRTGYLKYAIGSHMVYFRQSDAHIDVIRILHQSMDVGRHL